jgi:hypothetical protein
MIAVAGGILLAILLLAFWPVAIGGALLVALLAFVGHYFGAVGIAVTVVAALIWFIVQDQAQFRASRRTPFWPVG